MILCLPLEMNLSVNNNSMLLHRYTNVREIQTRVNDVPMSNYVSSDVACLKQRKAREN